MGHWGGVEWSPELPPRLSINPLPTVLVPWEWRERPLLEKIRNLQCVYCQLDEPAEFFDLIVL